MTKRPQVFKLSVQEARAFGALCAMLIAIPAILATLSERAFGDVVAIMLCGLIATISLFVAILLTRQKKYATSIALYLLATSAVACLLVTAFWKW